MYYGNIKMYDIANGEGIRVSLFLSGCKFHCKDCFNSEAWDFYYGKEYTRETEEQILDQIKLPYIKGLSLLGGDPLWQDVDGLKQLRKLVKKVHDLGKDVWIWSGFTYETLQEDSDLDEEDKWRLLLVQECDVFVDGQFEAAKKDLSLAWRGSKNQRVIDMRKTVKLMTKTKFGEPVKVVLYRE